LPEKSLGTGMPHIRRIRKTFCTHLPDNYYLKMRLLPWQKTKSNCTWLVSLAVSKSKHQINDWLNQRKNQRTKKLNNAMTGIWGPKIQALAVRQLRQWSSELPQGDCICFRCECIESEKQFKVWKKWFERHECNGWIFNKNFKYFLYCP